MLLSLNRVEISNIRSHKHFVFTPKSEGLTSISGPNGTGKSTLVDSIAWVLYGTKPRGVSKVIALVRTGVDVTKEKCYAIVNMTVDGEPIRIERRIVSKQGTIECEVFKTKKTDGESGNEVTDENTKWVNVAGPSVSHAEPYIRKLLGMDEKGFLSAVLIQQKQVDHLISASPRERSSIIEKLTGIASVTVAVDESKQEYNSLKKTAKDFTVDERQLGVLKKDRTTIKKDLSEKSESLKKKSEKGKKLRADGTQLRIEEEEEARRFDRATEISSRISNLNNLVESKTDELNRLIGEKDEKKNKLTQFAAFRSTDELEKELTDKKEELGGIGEKIYKLKNSILNDETKINEYHEVISDNIVKNIEPAENILQTAEKELKETGDEGQKQVTFKTTLKSKMDSISNAISIINQENGTCPTCLQQVSNVDHAVTSLRSELSGLELNLKSTEERIIELRKRRTDNEKTVESSRLLIEAIVNSEKLGKQLKESKNDLGLLLGNKKTLEIEVKTVEKVFYNAKMKDGLKQEYNTVLSHAKSASNNIEKMKRELIELEREKPKSLTTKQMESLRKKLETARNEYMTLNGAAVELKGEVKLLQEKLKNIDEKIDAQENETEKHKRLLKSIHLAGERTKLLEEFRVNRIENAIPNIEVYASDLISKFTEGVFTQLKLDDKFNAYAVLADGTKRPVGLLSGGELSLAAMALRLGISMMLNKGTNHGFIILDEVLSSQDTERSELILNTIKEVSKGQMILIAHNESVNDVADQKVLL